MSWAACHGYDEVVKMLVDFGADVKAQDKVSC